MAVRVERRRGNPSDGFFISGFCVQGVVPCRIVVQSWSATAGGCTSGNGRADDRAKPRSGIGRQRERGKAAERCIPCRTGTDSAKKLRNVSRPADSCMSEDRGSCRRRDNGQERMKRLSATDFIGFAMIFDGFCVWNQPYKKTRCKYPLGRKGSEQAASRV